MKGPAIRYHGGKFRLAPWVISHFPAHTTYVEPFGGAAGVLLQKPRALAGWQMNSTKSRISAGRGGALRTECLWLNKALTDRLHGGGLFAA